MPPKDETTEAFIKEYGELREKHRRDFLAVPQYVPDGKGGWMFVITTTVVPIDSSEGGIPTPFIP